MVLPATLLVGSAIDSGSPAFFASAAIAYDPEQPKDLSGVLAELAGHAWGKVLLWVIAIGLALFGLFCFAEAKYRRAV